jgi:hypothetical protein
MIGLEQAGTENWPAPWEKPRRPGGEIGSLPPPQQTRRQTQAVQLPRAPQSRSLAAIDRYRKSHRNPPEEFPPGARATSTSFEPPIFSRRWVGCNAKIPGERHERDTSGETRSCRCAFSISQPSHSRLAKL